MKTISRKFLLILSIIFVVCGMILIMPGALYAKSGNGNETKYDITTDCGPNGSISPDKDNNIKSGDNSKIFSIKPNKGYEIEDVKIDGNSIGVVTSYQFTNVTDDHVLSATFKEIIDTNGNSDTGRSGSIFLNGDPTKHANKSYKDFLKEKDCDVTLQPGQVLWHLVMTGIADGGTATIDGTEGVRHGKELQWTFINNLTTSPDWEAIVTNGITDKTDLKISHSCYGGDPTTGSITINKVVSGGLTGTFDFSITGNEGNEYNNTASITIAAGDTSGSATITGLAPGSYTVTETSTGAYTTSVDVTGGIVTVVAGQDVPITFTNTPTTTPPSGGGGGGAPAPTAAITVAAITTEPPAEEVAGASEEQGTIEVAGISNLPFTGQNSYLMIIGSVMLALGISMITILTLKRRKSKNMI